MLQSENNFWLAAVNGIFVNLPESQIEAIILHELAHIKRRDYLVNLIQIFCENVFFFNPALLWLSGLIREEREHCCDDLAISVMENKTSFVHALVSFQEYNVNGSPFEMAFSKKRNHLLDRIKRIIYNNNKAELKKAQEESEAHRWKAEEHRKAADVLREQSNELRIQSGKNREQSGSSTGVQYKK